MELSNEDALRLHVLLTHDLQAVRIDENAMVLYALTPKGEARVALHPSGRKEQYLRLVREMLSTHAIGSPGGYPLYIQRWTRMGQNLAENLDRLLLLGDEEAVVSVAYSPRLTDAVARAAWWCMQTGDNARRMLERACVQEGEMGPILADYLVEHLPFETSPHVIVDTVRIVLHPGLLNEAAVMRLWNRAKSDNTYYVGFLDARPDSLPGEAPARADLASLTCRLSALVDVGNPYAIQLQRILSPSGQTFLVACEEVLKRPLDQDVVRALFRAMGKYFGPLRVGEEQEGKPSQFAERAQARLAQPDQALASLLNAIPEYREELAALLTLSEVGESTVAPILVRTTAIGTLMRRKLEPITVPVAECLSALRTARAGG